MCVCVSVWALSAAVDFLIDCCIGGRQTGVSRHVPREVGNVIINFSRHRADWVVGRQQRQNPRHHPFQDVIIISIRPTNFSYGFVCLFLVKKRTGRVINKLI